MTLSRCIIVMCYLVTVRISETEVGIKTLLHASCRRSEKRSSAPTAHLQLHLSTLHHSLYLLSLSSKTSHRGVFLYSSFDTMFSILLLNFFRLVTGCSGHSTHGFKWASSTSRRLHAETRVTHSARSV